MNSGLPTVPGPVRAALPRLGVVASGIVSLLLASSLLLLFPVGLLIAPLGLVPVVQQVLSRRQGNLAWGWVIVLLAGLAVARLSLLGMPAWVFLLTYCLVVALPAASVALWVRWGGSEARWITFTTLAAALITMATIAAAALPATPVSALSVWWAQAATMMEASYRTLGVPSGQLELALDAMAGTVPWIAPSLPAAYLVALLFWLRPRLPVLGLERPIVAFERFRLDEWLPIGFVAGGAGTLLLSGSGRWVAVTLLVAVLMLYFVQGLAIIRAHLARWIGRGWLVRWGVALLCLQGPLPLVVAALGIADGFYSLRPRIDGGAS